MTFLPICGKIIHNQILDIVHGNYRFTLAFGPVKTGGGLFHLKGNDITMTEDRLLKIDQCLEIIPVAKSTFWAKVKEGKLPQPVRIGASTFWSYNDLMKFIAEQKEARICG